MSKLPALRILIADDEVPARNRLRELLAEIPETIITGEARNGMEALTMAEQEPPNVMLLDIRMPGMDGIEAAGHAHKLTAPPSIIFTTAYDTYAMQAFELNAVDYLLKPIRLERLANALKKARALLPEQLREIGQLRPQRTHFSVSERGRVLLIPLADVIYLRAELKYLTVRTREREYLIDESLTQIEEEFSDLFIRLHRNCLAARTSILGFEKCKEADGESHWVALLKDVPDVLPVSRRQQHIVHEITG
jgi:two-component system, LytTR family, response regulator AlgR